MTDMLEQSDLPQTKSDQPQTAQTVMGRDCRHGDRSESVAVPPSSSAGSGSEQASLGDHGLVRGVQVKPIQGVFSFLTSLLFHLLILVVLILIYQWSPRPGSRLGTRDTDTVGIVFSTPQGYEQPGGGSSGTSFVADQLLEQPSESVSQVTDAFLPSQNRIGMGASSQSETEVKESSGASSTTSQGSGTGTETGLGSGHGSGSGNGQSVGFSDLRGNGRRFVYILDRSESMKWPDGNPMNYALRETKASIASLDAKKGAARFQLVYYNHDAVVFENGRLMEVTAPNKDRVIRFLDSLYPDGGTDPLAAIEKAISLKPDVIFFLTDADEEIPMFNLERIRAVRQSSGVRQIHVVEFGKKTNVPKSSFRQLAAENNGQYIFKEISELK